MNTLLWTLLICAPSPINLAEEWPPAVWTQQVEPFKIIGPVYYVGGRELTAYLLVDEAGLILINVGMDKNVPLVLDSIRKLGFDPTRIRYLLITQSHFDHAGGAAQINKLSGAEVLAGSADLSLLKTGGLGDYVFNDDLPYSAVANPRGLRDGEQIQCGKLKLETIATPGHTPGCSSWRLALNEDGKTIQILFQGSISVLSDASLIQNPKYPDVVEDYRKSFKRLEAIKPDYVLPDHVIFAQPEEATSQDALVPAWFKRPEILAQQIERSRKELKRHLEEHN